jgi:riboflavin kinase/FMN adenylyltransferase
MAADRRAAGRLTDGVPFGAGSVVTVGTFDGVHRGHHAVLEELTSRARRRGRASVLVTFEPHPLAVLRPEQAPLRLTTRDERLEALAETAVDYVVVLAFDERLAGLEPDEFVEQVLVPRCGLTELVIGHDHGFGRGRRGDVTTLPALGKRLGFTVDVVDPVVDQDGAPISSSRIRGAIEATDFAAASRWLGRPYRVSGTVRVGAQRGRTIGVPTLNVLPPPDKLLPPDGVYAVRVEWGGGVAGGMMNQGPRPTVGDPTRWMEANLFDFEEDLYGRAVRIEWVARLRDVRKFGSLSELRAQLERDRQAAEAALSL